MFAFLRLLLQLAKFYKETVCVRQSFRMRNVPVIPVIPVRSFRPLFRSSQLLYSSFQVIPFIPVIPSRPKYNIYYWCCKQFAADSMYISFTAIARLGRGGGFYKCCPLQYLPATEGERLRKPPTVCIQIKNYVLKTGGKEYAKMYLYFTTGLLNLSSVNICGKVEEDDSKNREPLPIYPLHEKVKRSSSIFPYLLM
jgi:hypothetical protein